MKIECLGRQKRGGHLEGRKNGRVGNQKINLIIQVDRSRIQRLIRVGNVKTNRRLKDEFE